MLLVKLESRPCQAKFKIIFEFRSKPLPWWINKTMLENKHCPKILQPLLLNSKYYVDLVPPSWRFYLSLINNKQNKNSKENPI